MIAKYEKRMLENNLSQRKNYLVKALALGFVYNMKKSSIVWNFTNSLPS